MKPEIKQRIEQIKAGQVPDGYKKTKVCIIPNDWDLYKLSEISTELHECAGNGEYETLSISAGIGFVNQANKFGKEISGAQYSKYTVLNKGDFSYNKGNSKKYPQGCIYQLKDRESAAVPNVFESFRLTKGYNDYFEQLFVHGFLNSQLFSKINHGVRDDGLLNLRGNDFYSSYIVFPALYEQRKVAEILSAQDTVVELKEKLLEEKKKQKKYLMQQLLTGKKRLPGFSEGWNELPLSFFLDIRDEKQMPDSEAPLMAFVAEKGIVEKGERYDRSFLVKDDSKQYKRTELNDFIYSSNNLDVGSIGLNQYGTAVISVVYEIFKVKETAIPIVLSEIIQMPINMNKILRFRQGALYGQYKIHPSEFLKVKVKIPNIDEQSALSEIMGLIDDEITLITKELEQEKQKKKALMQLLLTGIVRVDK